jgi:hypothetical protein
VAIRVPGNGNYTLSVSTFPQFHLSTLLKIEDLRTGIIQPLSPEHPFTFQAAAGDQSGRFRLILSTNGGRLDEVEMVELVETVELVYKNKEIRIKSNGFNLNGFELTLYDLIGRPVKRIQSTNGTQGINIDDQFTTGVYLWTIKSGQINTSGKIFLFF